MLTTVLYIANITSGTPVSIHYSETSMFCKFEFLNNGVFEYIENRNSKSIVIKKPSLNSFATFCSV